MNSTTRPPHTFRDVAPSWEGREVYVQADPMSSMRNFEEVVGRIISHQPRVFRVRWFVPNRISELGHNTVYEALNRRLYIDVNSVPPDAWPAYVRPTELPRFNMDPIVAQTIDKLVASIPTTACDCPEWKEHITVPLNDGLRFCPWCGKKLMETPPTEPPQPGKSRYDLIRGTDEPD